MELNEKLYKVYCGTNGKWYTFRDKFRAENLVNKLREMNYRYELVEVVKPQHK